MSVEYKAKNDLPDLYNILGLTIDICKEKNCDELIHKAYVKKAKVCHPDKHPGRKDVEEVFELLTRAYNVLNDEKKRNEYNHKLSLNKQSSSDFTKLKKSAQDYTDTIGQYVPPTDQQKLTFKDKMKELDAKHGFDSSQSGSISSQDAKKRMNDMTKTRAVQDVKLKPDRLFAEGEPMDLKKFNAMFDMVHKRDEGSIMTHNGVPAAWNDASNVLNYSSFDNLDNIYVEDNNRVDTSRQSFASADFGTPMMKINKDEIKNIKGADYVDGHNAIGNDYYNDLKAKLRSRQSESGSFDSMKYNDFKRDDMAGYGIFDQLGYKFDDRLALDVEEDDIAKKFERIMAERQKDLLPANAQVPTPMPQPKSTKTKNNKSWR